MYCNSLWLFRNVKRLREIVRDWGGCDGLVIDNSSLIKNSYLKLIGIHPKVDYNGMISNIRVN